MRIYVQLCKTRQFANADIAFKSGVHLRKPSVRELANAVIDADTKGFQTVYVYDSSKSLTDLADMIQEGMGILVGWSNFCQTVDAFVIDSRCYDAETFKPIEFGT